MHATTPHEARAHAESSPTNVLAQMAAAYACEAAGHQEAALSYYRRAWALHPPEPQARTFAVHYGSALAHSGLWADAREVLEVALDRWPEDRALKCYLTLALHHTGDAEAALGELMGVVLGFAEQCPDLVPYAWDLAGWEAELMMEAATPEAGAAASEEGS